MWRLPSRRMAFNSTPYPAGVFFERQTSRLHVVKDGSQRVHSSPKTTRRYPKPIAPRRTILYIGGDPDCRIVLLRILRRLENTQLVVAGTGREGRLLAFSSTPSLILLDTQLSDCDAVDLMGYFGRATLGATVPLAVLSGNEMDRMRFIRAGAVAWIAKPVRIAQVERSVMTLLELVATR